MVLQQLASEGMGVLLVEHDMALVMAICARVDVLDNGLVIARGDPGHGAGQPRRQEAYLGGETESARPPARRPRGASAPARAADDGGADGTDPAAARSLRRRVRAGYGRIEVLHGISLSVRAGSAMALLGPNGAGKTTLLKAISGRFR